MVGPNASGKTNLLEALYVAARGKSFKARDAHLISHHRPWARIDIDLAGNNPRTVKLKEARPVEKSFEVGTQTARRLKPEHLLPVVLFEPEHLRLLNGSPRLRREYLDGLIAQIYSQRAELIRRYDRVLKQRNALLKQRTSDQDELFVWSVKLAELGGQIYDWRQELVAQLNKHVPGIYSALAGGKHSVSIRYEPSVTGDYKAGLHKHLLSDVDSRVGFTSAGPHRDDIAFSLDGILSSQAASRGENRTLVLTAKLTELALVEEKFKTKPLLLLDDVFSELDGRRRRELAAYLKGYQTIITTTDADAVVEHFLKKEIKIIPLG